MNPKYFEFLFIMVLCRLSFLVLFIPIVLGINETATKNESNHNITVSTPQNLLQKEENSTRKSFTLAAEGGSIQVPQSNSTLLMENDAVQLPKLPSGDFGESSTKNKGKHVVGRTGAPVIDLKDSSINTPISIESKNISSKAPVPVQKSTIINKLPTHISTSVQPPSSSKIPHKPTVLRYEEGSSIVADGKPPGISEATQASKPGSHPGMIMPVVITILVVPLFAVLGYMALKRGQEAWKNRHYKRMDFLLDGMYND